MRHAKTDFNISKVWTGHLDINIASTIKHPRICHPTQPVDLDVIICSSARRCTQTLTLMDTPNTHIIHDPCFIECGYGKYTGLPKDKDTFRRSFYNSPESSDVHIGESRLAGGLRAFKRYQELLLEHNLQDKNVMILSHKNTLCGFWVLHYLDMYYASIGNCLDMEKIDAVPEQHVEEVLYRHPIPSPFVNTKPYELMRW
jgi:broad specificity phosphatase PhoE